MKNLPLILNVVLLVAVGVLYYLHFAPKKSASSDTTSSFDIGELKLAYINSDSVLSKYEYLKASAEILEAKSKKVEQDYINRAQSLQKEIEAYQRNVNNMTVGQVRAVEEDIGILGYHPEMMDYSNPRGAIYGSVYTAVAYLPNGEVRGYETTDSVDRAISDVCWFEENGFIPENHRRWMYGNRECEEEQLAFEERQKENELNGLY